VQRGSGVKQYSYDIDRARDLREALDALSDAKERLVQARNDADVARIAADDAAQRRFAAAQHVGKLQAKLDKLRDE
jgi:hypothetical protein